MNTTQEQKQPQDFSNPQKFMEQLQEKNTLFFQELSNSMLSLAQEGLAKQKQAQEEITAYAQKMQKLLTTSPVDVPAVQQAASDFNNKLIAQQQKAVQESFYKAQKLFNIYFIS